jgi:hypothetical protein
MISTLNNPIEATGASQSQQGEHSLDLLLNPNEGM